MKSLSTHAHAAKLIRQELKAAFPKLQVRVSSQSYAGGNSVDVNITDQPPHIKQAIDKIVGKYQYGHFDSMNDCYEYTNSRNDIPQVKYAFVRNELSPTLRQVIGQFLRDTFVAGDSIFERLDTYVWREFSDVNGDFWKSV